MIGGPARKLRSSASASFYLLFVAGALLSCALAVGIVWVASDQTFSNFQKQSTEFEAEASAANLKLFIDDRRRTLVKLASDSRVVSAVLGNVGARAAVEELFSSAQSFNDERRLTLLSLTHEQIVDQKLAEFDVEASYRQLFRQSAAMLASGDGAPRISYFEAEGRAIIAIAAPVRYLSVTEGVLYGEFDFTPYVSAQDGARAVSLYAAGAEPTRVETDVEKWMAIDTPIDGADVVSRYLRNVEDLGASKMLALAKTAAALVVGLAIAFAALCLIGRTLMLNPYRALQASEASLAKSNRMLEHTSLHDALTGIPNRRYLEEFLSELVKPPRRGQAEPFAILHIDLDRFKQINDTLGHAAGDHVLVEVGILLKKNIRKNDFVARIGGDEFVMIIMDADDRAEIGGRARQLIEAASKPLHFDGNECRFGASIGVAFGQRGVSDPKKLLMEADIALYRAKERGRNDYAFFTDADAQRVREKKTLADQIQKALDNGEFFPVYQPQVDAFSNQLVAVEALARWRHPEHGVLAPAAFIQTADDLGVIGEIDNQIMLRALEEIARLGPSGGSLPRVSVNVSEKRLHDPQLVATIERLGLAPGRLTLELLESSFLDNPSDLIVDNLKRIRALGVDIEIDDFGTGHSSIIALARLEPSRLKIDRQFIAPAVDSEVNRKLISAMVDIAGVLNVGVVAEGVETAEHIALLRKLGCETLQGYAIARPLDIDALAAWISTRTVDAAEGAGDPRRAG